MDGSSSKNFLLTSIDVPQHTTPTTTTIPLSPSSSSIELEGYGKCSFCECTQYFPPSSATSTQKGSKECSNCPHPESLHVKLRLTLSTRDTTPVANIERNRRLSVSMPILQDGYGAHSLVPNSLKIDLLKDSFSDNLQAFNDDFKWNRVQEEEVLNSVNRYIIDHYSSLFSSSRQQRGILTDHDWDVIIERYIPQNFLRIIDQTKSALVQKYERLSFQLLMLHQYNLQNNSSGNASAISWRYRIDTLRKMVEDSLPHVEEIDKRRYRIVYNLLLKRFNANEVTKSACFQENAISWNDQDKDKQKKIDECRLALASILPDLVSNNQKIWITSKLHQSESEFQERLSILLLYLQNPTSEVSQLDCLPILSLYKITENFSNQLREMLDSWEANDGSTVAQTNVTAPLFVISRPKFVTTYREYFVWMTKVLELKNSLPSQIIKLIELPRQRLRRYADFVNAFLELQPLDAQNNHMNIVRFSLITALNDIQSLLSFSYNITDYENTLQELANNYPEFSGKNLLYRRIGKLSVSTAKDSQSSSREDLFENAGEKSRPKKLLRLFLFDDGLLIENMLPEEDHAFEKSFRYRIFPVESVKAVVINRAGRTSSNAHSRGRFRIVINEPDKSIRDLFQDFEQPQIDYKNKRRSLYSAKSKSLGATLHGFASSNSLVDSQTTANDITIKFKVATREEAMMWVHDITSSVDLFKREEPANNNSGGRDSADYGSLRRKQMEGFTWKKFLNINSEKDKEKEKDKDKEKEKDKDKDGKAPFRAATLRNPEKRTRGELYRSASSLVSPFSSSSKSGTLANPVFGVPLKTVMSRPNESGVPFVVQECANYVLLKGLQTEGIFRISAQHKQLDVVAKLFDEGKITSLFDQNLDIHLVCGLLTKYLRDLPTPLTENYHGAFMVCQKAIDKQIEANKWTKEEEAEVLIPKYRDICHLLPPENYELLKYLIRFLGEISEHSEQNKMNIKNLSTIFGPLLLHTVETDTPVAASDVRKSISDKMAESLLQSNIVENFLVHRHGIFEDKRRHSII